MQAPIITILKCQLCLKEQTKKSCELATETVLEILEALCISIEVVSGPDAVICKLCSETLDTLFQFKSNCILTEDFLSPYYSNHKTKISLINILLKDKEDKPQTEDMKICRLCLNIISEASYLIDDITKEDSDKTLKVYLPELELDAVEDRHICQACDKDLQTLIEFYRCISTSKKILAYEKDKTIKGNFKIDLTDENNLQTIKNECQIKDFSVVVKEEETEITIEEHFEEASVKQDDKTLISTIINNKRKASRINRTKNEPKGKIYYCSTCPYKTVREECLEIHVMRHKNSEVCDICGYATYVPSWMKRHREKHEPSQNIKCPHCDFIAKSKHYLGAHTRLSHAKGPKPKYKCKFCPSEYSSQTTLKAHVVRLHTDESKLKKYECYTCGYTNILKKNLIWHTRRHLEDLRTTLFKCDICNFATKYSENIQKHKRKHKEIKEEDMHKCNLCSYKTKNKKCLKPHFNNVHKDINEVTHYSCKYCGYKTKHRGAYKRHLSRHESPIETYNCELCSFKSINKYQLVRHTKLIHEKSISVCRNGIHKCHQCDFETDDYQASRKHYKTHYNVNIATRGPYICDICSLEMTTPWSITKHKIIAHGDVSERTIYKCDSCDFESIYKSSLRQHIERKHTNISEKTKFQCRFCDLQSLYRGSITKHLRRMHQEKIKNKLIPENKKAPNYSKFIRKIL